MLSLDTIAADPFMNPGGLSTTAIRSLMNHVGQTSIIDFSFSLADRNLTAIPVPGGDPLVSGDASEMPPRYAQKASVEIQTSRSAHGQMTLDLTELPGLSYNSLYHRLRPHCDYFVSLPSGRKRILHIPLGVYMGVLPPRDLSEQVPVWRGLTLYDETWDLNRRFFENNWVVPAGTNLVQEAITLLQLDDNGVSRGGCPVPGPGIPSSRISIPPDPASVAPFDITFTTTDTFLQAINDLLGACTNPYWGLRQNALGVYTSSPVPLNASSSAQPGWTLSDTRGSNPETGEGNIMKGPLKQTFDGSELANVVVVTSTNGQSKGYYARAENHDLRSAISIENYGEKIIKTVQADNLGSNEDCYTRAAIEVQLAAAVNQTVTVDHVIIPVWEAHDRNYVECRSATPTFKGRGEDIEVVYSDGPEYLAANFLELSHTWDFTTRLQHTVVGALTAV